jgi:hypothetical protein
MNGLFASPSLLLYRLGKFFNYLYRSPDSAKQLS